MAITLIKKITERPTSIVSDGTNLFVGTGNGKVLKVVISTKVKTVLANIGQGAITALCSDGTYLYAGDTRGNFTRVTIADGTKSSLEKGLRGVINGASHNTSTRYICFSDGRLASRA